jgi:hypothetical protein
VEVKQVEFMVRNGDYIKDIASKTKVPVREILKLNKLRSKKFLAYPGLRLLMPVQVQSHVWDPTKEDMTGNSPSREDRGGSDDYELVVDSSNYSLIDDFIDLSAARNDSIEYANIDNHLRKIDKAIKYLAHKIDSIKQTDFKFDYEDQDKNSILSKMKLARDNYYAEGPIGRQIDSLKDEKVWLGQRRIILRNQIAEYEYLADNASYSEGHYRHDEKQRPTNWGSHLAYESIYVKNKEAADEARNKGIQPDTAKKAPAPAPVVAKRDTIVPPPIVPIAKSEMPLPKVAKISMDTSTHLSAVSSPPAESMAQPVAAVSVPKTEAPAPIVVKTPVDIAPKETSQSKPVAAVSQPAPVKTETPTASVKITEQDKAVQTVDLASDEEPITHYKSDFAALPKQKYNTQIKDITMPQRPLVMPANFAGPMKMPTSTSLSPSPTTASAPVKQVPKSQSSDPVNNKPTETASVAASTKGTKQTTTIVTTTTINKTTDTAPVIPQSKETPVVTTIGNTTTNKTADTVPVILITKETIHARTTDNTNITKPIETPPIKEPSPAPIVKAPDNTPHLSSPRVQSILTDTPIVKHIAETIDAATPIRTATIATSDKPFMSLDSKIDTTIVRPEKPVNTDPLASYKTDSDFVVKRDIQIKDIPIEEYKNKPKYLLPVDSVSKIKGDFYLIRARQVLEKGDFKTGDKYLRKSLDLDPTNPQAWMLHADLFLTLGLADQALKEYEISGEIDSTNPKVFYNIALLYVKANNHQKAYKYFSKAIEVSNKYLLAYMGRASLLMDDRDYEGAIQDYDRLLAVNKYYSPAFKQRGLAKMELRKFNEAIIDFNQYLEIEDPDGYVVYQRGISKIYSNSLLQGCLDLSSAQELGFKEAEKAIKKFCE